MLVEVTMQLPEGFCQLKTQVAGHTFQLNTDAIGILQDARTGCVYKPLGKPACGERELAFYKSLQDSKNTFLIQVKPFVPHFYHEVKLAVNCCEYTFLKLEDLTHGMTKPCVMDIKVGKRTWDPLASPEKRELEEHKYSECKQALGLCLPGFQMYQSCNGLDNSVLRKGKAYGKNLDVKGFRATIALFLNAKPTLYVPLVHEILKQLKAIRGWFSVQTLLHFYASSLLIAYDFDQLYAHIGTSFQNGQLSNGKSNNTSEKSMLTQVDWVKVKMIDFAHVFPAENGLLDANYLYGLEKLISVLESLLYDR